MADILWGNVYFKDIYAGKLQEQPDGRYIFTYDASYLNSGQPAISYSLPLHEEPYVSEHASLHPFFDNLVSEGWHYEAQISNTGRKHRFGCLLDFGYDLIGAVSIMDPTPIKRKVLQVEDEAIIAVGKGRASVGGFQKKLLVIKDGNTYRPSNATELSTHIAKFDNNRLNSDGKVSDYIDIEYLTSLAVAKLLPEDVVVAMEIARVEGVDERALIITRFDRLRGKRLHFEEFNQLLGHYSYDSDDKYNGAYEDMARFMRADPNCSILEAEILLRRILANLLVGNTDAHLKNFAMFHNNEGMSLTPLYDVLAVTMCDRKWDKIALSIAGAKDLIINTIKRKNLLLLGKGFGFAEEVTIKAINDLGKGLPRALSSIEKSEVGTKLLRDELIQKTEARWRGSFASTGQI